MDVLKMVVITENIGAGQRISAVCLLAHVNDETDNGRDKGAQE